MKPDLLSNPLYQDWSITCREAFIKCINKEITSVQLQQRFGTSDLRALAKELGIKTSKTDEYGKRFQYDKFGLFLKITDALLEKEVGQ